VVKVHAAFRLGTGCCLLLLSSCATLPGSADNSTKFISQKADDSPHLPPLDDCVLVVQDAKAGTEQCRWVPLAQAKTVRQLIENSPDLQPGIREKRIYIDRLTQNDDPRVFPVCIEGAEYDLPLQAWDRVYFLPRWGWDSVGAVRIFDPWQRIVGAFEKITQPCDFNR
jgi:hypothetical protein